MSCRNLVHKQMYADKSNIAIKHRNNPTHNPTNPSSEKYSTCSETDRRCKSPIKAVIGPVGLKIGMGHAEKSA